jgi:hypothetical protein
MSTIEKKVVRSGNYVGTEHVDTLIRNYKKERWIQNSENLGKDDTLDVWYSLEELEEFIQTAKLHGSDGIRLCFGVYGEHNAPKPGLEGKQTVAFVATRGEDEGLGAPVLRDVYVRKNGKADLLAYNTATGYPWGLPGGGTLGTIMVADKDKGMRMI